MTGQSKLASLKEAVVNTIVSMGGTYIIQYVLNPLIGIETSNKQIWITSLVFGLANTIKTYLVRRYFNKAQEK